MRYIMITVVNMTKNSIKLSDLFLKQQTIKFYHQKQLKPANRSESNLKVLLCVRLSHFSRIPPSHMNSFKFDFTTTKQKENVINKCLINLYIENIMRVFNQINLTQSSPNYKAGNSTAWNVTR